MESKAAQPESIQLVIDVEDAFGIKITDEEAESTQTVGQLYQLVCHKTKNNLPKDYCTTQKAFYRLRKVLSSELRLDKKQITPKTQTELIFPEIDRITQWKKVSNAINLKFPTLYWSEIVSKIWFTSIMILTLTILIIFGIIIPILFGNNEAGNHLAPIFEYLLYFSVVTLLTTILIILSINRYAIKQTIPSFCETLAQLTKTIIYNNPENFKPFSENDIWDILTVIISGVLCVNSEDIKPEHSFVKDLGLVE